MPKTSDRINALIERLGFASYLLIGKVDHDNYSDVSVQRKIAVDSLDECETAASPGHEQANQESLGDGKWDIIHITGGRAFGDAFSLFKACRSYGHDNTILIMDNTFPFQEGDDGMFRAVLAIHDAFPDYSYCTLVPDGMPQTFFWRTVVSGCREPLFSRPEMAAALGVSDVWRHAAYAMPLDEDRLLPSLIGMHVDPACPFKYSDYGMRLAKSMNSEKECRRRGTRKSIYPSLAQRIFIIPFLAYLKAVKPHEYRAFYKKNPVRYLATTQIPLGVATRWIVQRIGPTPASGWEMHGLPEP